MRLQIPNKLLPLVSKPKRLKIIIGGRGSGKSMGVGGALIMKAQTEQANVMCLREYQNSISDSVHALLKAEIDRLDVHGSEITDSKIDFKGGGGFRYKGMSRDTAAIKSAHGFKYSWVEEAQTMSQKSIDDLLPTIREAGSECWFTANPQSSADPFSQEFISPFHKELLKNGYYEDDLRLIILINYKDNPFFPEELNQQRLDNKENWTAAKYNHIWEGAFNDEVEDSIIPQEWFEACIDAHIKLGFKPRGQKILSHDPSDVGKDAAAYAIRHGSVILESKSYDKKDVNDNCDVALEAAIQNNVDVFSWDGDGLGASLKREIASALDGKPIKLEMFKGSESPDYPDDKYQDIEDLKAETLNKHMFKNKRAQYYWNLRDRCYRTYKAVINNERVIDVEELISFSSKIENIENLKSEICRIPKKANNNGFIQIMTKQEMWTKHQIASPNESDCIMMVLRFTKVQKWSSINYGKVSIA